MPVKNVCVAKKDDIAATSVVAGKVVKEGRLMVLSAIASLLRPSRPLPRSLPSFKHQFPDSDLWLSALPQFPRGRRSFNWGVGQYTQYFQPLREL